MTGLIALEILGLLVLFALSAFFSSSESALFSLTPLQVHRIRAAHPRAAQRIERILAHPTRLLSTILVGNTLVNVAASGFGYLMIEDLFPDRGVWIAIPALTFLILVFGEIFPKRLALHRPERMSVLYAGALEALNRFLVPAWAVLEWLTRWSEGALRPTGARITEEEFVTAVEESHQRGILDREERVMVDGIIRLEGKQASDIMTPRVDLVGMDLDEDSADFESVARSVRFKYLPVYRESPDHIEGFLDVPRYLLSPDRNLEASLLSPFFVPETVPLDTLLMTFQREKRRIACVTDEFGGTAGVVTRGDIMEEIVAGVESEYGETEPEIRAIGPNRWVVDGSVSLEEVNYELGLELESEGADRVSGWITGHLERIPRQGDVVEAQACRVTVSVVRKRRVIQVVLEKTDGET